MVLCSSSYVAYVLQNNIAIPMLYIQSECLPLDSIFSLQAEDCKDKITLNEGSLTSCTVLH